MLLGLSLENFTLAHVAISLAGIVSGSVVIYGFLMNKRFDAWTAIFLVATALTSITGFMIPFDKITPGIMVGIISIVVLAVAVVARYPLQLKWRKAYVMAACVAQYLNVFVLVVQSFQKIPALKALAPTQKEPPFAMTQLGVLVLFIVLTVFSVKRFHPQTSQASAAAAGF